MNTLTKAEYVKNLIDRGDDYVWLFTKQTPDFDIGLGATKLFNEWKQRNDEDTNLEGYFNDYSSIFGTTNNHRVLVLSQIFGLLTKRGNIYKNEETTAVFSEIINANNQEEKNILVSEQLLKFKLKSIGDKAPLVPERHIFPIIFIYQVLIKLKKVGINHISFEDLYLFVMTMNTHSQVDLSVKYIRSVERYQDVTALIKKYKDRSRFLLVLDNLDVFNISNEQIKINAEFQGSMDHFIKEKISKLPELDLTNDDDLYKDFLGKVQGFEISLIGIRNIQVVDAVTEVKEDSEYILEINKAGNLTSEIESDYQSHYLTPPNVTNNIRGTTTKRNPTIGKIALKASNYLCEFNNRHLTFTSGVTGRNYTEAHHLIPFQFQQKYWDETNRNIDCLENIVSLCPNCHKAVHYGTFDEKQIILKSLFIKKIEKMRNIDIDLSEQQLIEMYV